MPWGRDKRPTNIQKNINKINDGKWKSCLSRLLNLHNIFPDFLIVISNKSKLECVLFEHEEKYIYGTLIFNMLRRRIEAWEILCERNFSFLLTKRNAEGFFLPLRLRLLPAVCELKCECFSCLMAYTCCCLSIPKIRFSFHLIGFPIFLFSKLREAQAGKQQCLTVQSLFVKWKYYLVEEFWIRRCKDFLNAKYWVSMLLFVRKETRFLFEKRWLHIFVHSRMIYRAKICRGICL